MMASDRPRSVYELRKPPYWNAAIRSAVQTAISHELRARYEVPQDLPHEMLTLLMQLNERHEDDEPPQLATELELVIASAVVSWLAERRKTRVRRTSRQSRARP